MTSTQRVEGINSIIKKYINLQNNLVEFFQGIQAFLQNQISKAEYRDWIESLPQTNLSATSASERIFPCIIKELKKYLTIEMYFIQKAQLDMSLEYNAMLILPEQYESFFEEVSKYDHLKSIIISLVFFYHEQYFCNLYFQINFIRILIILILDLIF